MWFLGDFGFVSDAACFSVDAHSFCLSAGSDGSLRGKNHSLVSLCVPLLFSLRDEIAVIKHCSH